MKAYIVLTNRTDPPEVHINRHVPDQPIGVVSIDGLDIQSVDPDRLDALGAAFILAATQLADAKAKAKA